MKNIIAIVSLTVLLTGCATVSPTHDQNGKQSYSLNCSGLARGWDKCLKAAGDLCGTRGYKIIDRTDEDMASMGATSGGFYGAKTNERAMQITCK